MDYKFSDLVDIDKLRSLLENYYKITHMPSGILGVNGELLAAAGWRRICADFHKNNSDSRRVCKLSNENLKKCKFEKEKYDVMECGNGLVYIVCPIIINDLHVANICQGQYFLKKPDIARFREQARRYGFDEREYIKAIEEVPIVSIDDSEPSIKFLSKFAEILGEMGLKQLELMESQKRLKTSEECWKFAVEAAGDGVWDWNVQTEEMHFSDRCYEITGYGEEDIEHIRKNWVSKIHREDLVKMETCMESHFAGKRQTFSSEIRFTCGDGNVKWIYIRGKLVNRTEAGTPLRVIGVCIDINEKKRLEQEAIELDMLKNEFLANISHELKTPLNVIYSASQLLDLYINSNSVSENIEKIKIHQKVVKQNCYRSQRLINNLIDISRIDSGYFEIKPVNDNIVSVVEEIALSVKDYIESNGISFIFDTTIEEKFIAFDPDKMERVVLNLISNAVKFTEPGGSISIRISESDGKVIISVKDTGIGIPGDKLDIIFERFKQVDGLFIRRSEGSGIGLTLVKSIVELHGGKIRVESECGKGSEFIIELPDCLVQSDQTEAKGMNVKGNEQGFIETVNIEFSDIYSKQ